MIDKRKTVTSFLNGTLDPSDLMFEPGKKYSKEYISKMIKGSKNLKRKVIKRKNKEGAFTYQVLGLNIGFIQILKGRGKNTHLICAY